MKKRTTYFLVKMILPLILFYNVQAKIIEKILAIFDNQIITMSQVEKIKHNIEVRREISPHIYLKSDYQDKEIVDEIIKTKIIREALNRLGTSLTEEDVNKQIKNNEDRVHLQHSQLIQFIESKNLTYDEYHQLIKEAMERNIFQSQVVATTVSIPEQVIKNTFYKRNASDNTLNFRYDLVNFIYSKKKINFTQNEIDNAIKLYLEKGIFSEKFKDIKISNLGTIEEDFLDKEVRDSLKNTNEGDISKPIEIANEMNIFFIKKKDLIESQKYQQAKAQIESELTIKEIEKMTELYIEREKNKHFIKINI